MKLHLKFLISKHRLNDDLMEKYGIDQKCIELMELIFVRQAQMATLTVSEIMKIKKCGSPATIHRSLINLRDKDLLVFLHKGTRAC